MTFGSVSSVTALYACGLNVCSDFSQSPDAEVAANQMRKRYGENVQDSLYRRLNL